MKEIARDVVRIPTSFVNSYLLGSPSGPWLLVDTGLPGFAWKIKRAAVERFGDRRPEAIVLTHGHIDHVGSARRLADYWNVPIYIHWRELPYLNGRSGYPPPDPTVGGFLALGSRLMPYGPRDLGARIRLLEESEPGGGMLPHLDEWKWLHTPGHSPGHLSLFRETDRTLIAGDALATADFDSYLGALTRSKKLSRGGTPFVCDWGQTHESVWKLSNLEPNTIVAGHGRPMSGVDLPKLLERFARDFTHPAHGRYAFRPAMTDETGVVVLPPPAPDPLPKYVAITAVTALAAAWLFGRRRKASARELPAA